MGRGQQTSTVKDAFSAIFGDRRGLTGEQAQQQMDVRSPFSRLRDVAYRRMALLDWWLDQGVTATAEEALRIKPYSRMDSQVAGALFKHDAEAMMRLDMGSEIVRSQHPSLPRQFIIVPFSKWPPECQEELERWRAQGRPLLEPDGSLSHLGEAQAIFR
jgi:hypothetical protein